MSECGASESGGGAAAIACKQFNGKGQRKVTKEGRKAEAKEGTVEGNRHTRERERERERWFRPSKIACLRANQVAAKLSATLAINWGEVVGRGGRVPFRNVDGLKLKWVLRKRLSQWKKL